MANNLKHILIPDKSTTSKEVKKQLAEIVCDFHVKYRKLLVKLLRLDQLDIMFLKSIADMFLQNNKIDKFLGFHKLFNVYEYKIIEKLFLSLLSTGSDLNIVFKYADNSKILKLKFLNQLTDLFVVLCLTQLLQKNKKF